RGKAVPQERPAGEPGNTASRRGFKSAPQASGNTGRATREGGAVRGAGEAGETLRRAGDASPLAHLAEGATPSPPKAAAEGLGLTLLRALAVDARQSQRALARAVGMSPPAIADRLARLERSGTIRGYRVEIDWAALGYPVVVYLAVTAGPGTDLSQIIRAIPQLPDAPAMRLVTRR